jgi:predicted ribosomally synthesized peptide with nif11-like leader
MPQNTVLAFFDRVEKDAALQGKLRNLDLQNETHLPQLLKIATDAGYPFAAEDWKNAGKQRAEALQAKYWAVGETELSDEELSAVAGGADKSHNTCNQWGLSCDSTLSEPH